MPRVKVRVPGTKVVFNVEGANYAELDAKITDIKTRYTNKTKGQIVVGERERKGAGPGPASPSSFTGKPAGYEPEGGMSPEVTAKDFFSGFTLPEGPQIKVPEGPEISPAVTAVPRPAYGESLNVPEGKAAPAQAPPSDTRTFGQRILSMREGLGLNPRGGITPPVAPPTVSTPKRTSYGEDLLTDEGRPEPISTVPSAGSKFLASSAVDRVNADMEKAARVAGLQQKAQAVPLTRFLRGEPTIPATQWVDDEALDAAANAMPAGAGGPAVGQAGAVALRTGARVLEGVSSPLGLGAAAVAATGPIGAAAVASGFGLKMLYDFSKTAGPKALEDLLAGDKESLLRNSGPDALATGIGILGSLAGYMGVRGQANPQIEAIPGQVRGAVKGALADRAVRAESRPLVKELLKADAARAKAGQPPPEIPGAPEGVPPVEPPGTPPAAPPGLPPEPVVPAQGRGPVAPEPPVGTPEAPVAATGPAEVQAGPAPAPDVAGKPTSTIELEPPGGPPPAPPPKGTPITDEIVAGAERVPLERILAEDAGKTQYPIKAINRKFGTPVTVIGPPEDVEDDDGKVTQRVPVQFDSGIKGRIPVQNLDGFREEKPADEAPAPVEAEVAPEVAPEEEYRPESEREKFPDPEDVETGAQTRGPGDYEWGKEPEPYSVITQDGYPDSSAIEMSDSIPKGWTVVSEHANEQDAVKALAAHRAAPPTSTAAGRAHDGTSTYEDAVDLVVSEQMASVAFIQRRLGVSHDTAAEFLDRMTREGMIGERDPKTGEREIKRPAGPDTPAAYQAEREAKFGKDRSYRPDGRVIPVPGEKVYHTTGVPLGDAQLNGEVLPGPRSSLLVKITGSSGGVTHLKGKTFPLDERWTVVGDATDKERQRRALNKRNREKSERERAADDERLTAKVGAARAAAKKSGRPLVEVKEGVPNVPDGASVYSHVMNVHGTVDGDGVRWAHDPDRIAPLDEDPGTITLAEDEEGAPSGDAAEAPMAPTSKHAERRERTETSARVEKLQQLREDGRITKEELEELLSLTEGRLQESRRETKTHYSGLWNKQGWEEAIQKGYYDRFIAIDLKQFKWFNDTHGYSAGSAAIECAANHVGRLAAFFGGAGFAIGGDEFVIAFDHKITTLEEAERDVEREFAEAIVEGISKDGTPYAYKGIPIHMVGGKNADVVDQLKTAGRSTPTPWTALVRTGGGEGEDHLAADGPKGVGRGEPEMEGEGQGGLFLEEPKPEERKTGRLKAEEKSLPPAVAKVLKIRDEILRQAAPAGSYDKALPKGERHQPPSWKLLRELAASVKVGTGLEVITDYSSNDLYDAMELAVNKLAATDRRFIGNRETLRELIENLPTKTTRDSDTDKFQQFSTPADYAAVAAKLAGIKPGDVVLEPTVGLGSLAAAARGRGAKVIGNELEPGRAALVEHAGIGLDAVHTENAEYIHAALAKDLKGDNQPTVVLMNPPFSAAVGTNTKAILTAGRHILSAFKTLAPGGRLVAIVGAGMSPLAPKYRVAFDEMKKAGAVLVANLNLADARDMYAKYGTSFPTRVLIWDKDSKAIPILREQNIQSLKQLEEYLPRIPERATIEKEDTGEGTRRGERPAPEPAGESKARPGGGAGPGVSLQPTADGMGAETGDGLAPGEQSSAGRRRPVSDDAPGVAPEESVGVAGTPGRGAGPGARSPKTGPGGAPQPDAGGGRGKPAGGVLRPPVLDVEPGAGLDATDLTIDQVASSADSADLSTSVFERYEPTIKVPGLQPHPAKLVESAAMSVVRYPPVTYSPFISKKSMESGAISDAQFEAIALAGNAHDQLLPSGERRGFLVGDGTGVGKARIIAGIIADNWKRGRKRAVWVTENWRLVEDIKKELASINMDPDAVMRLDKVASDGAIPDKDGILVVTYTTLAAESSGKKKKAKKKVDVAQDRDVSQEEFQAAITALAVGEPEPKGNVVARLDQVKAWLGPSFEGAIAYDESHNMANAVTTSKGGRKKMPSKRALAGLALSRDLPKARVVYASATAATEVSNLAYADRLGLWGEETAFPDKANFIASMAGGGITAMELVAQGMKAAGVYCARTLSFEGVEVERLQHDLLAHQKEMWDKLAAAWRLVSKNIDEALKVTAQDHAGRVSKWAKLNAYNQYWAVNQRFWNQVLTSMQMPTVLEDMGRQIKNGHSVVVQLTLTGKAQLDRATKEMEEDDDLESLDLTPKRSLLEYVEKSFPVYQMVEKTDEDGNVKMVYAKDSEGNHIENPEAVAMRDKLLLDLSTLPVPEGALDQLINHFGPDKVAEVTGRDRRLVRGKDGQLYEEKRGSTANEAEVKAFMSDRKQILVFSEAGGTGASYHSSRTVENKRRRYHYLLQPGWRADKAIQGLGRTHRSNQANAPVDILVSTDVPGHKRFVSTIARRMAQSGALTKGQRSAAGQGMFTEADNLESPLAEQALHQLYSLINTGGVAGMPREDFTERTGLVIDDFDKPPMTQFLNRVLSMNLEDQKTLFDLLAGTLGHLIDVARQDGTLELGVEDIRADEVSEARRVVVNVDKRSKAETVYYELVSKKKRTPLEFPEKRVERYIKNKASGRVRALLNHRASTTDKQGVVHIRMLTATPFGDGWESEEDFYRLYTKELDATKYQEIDRDEALELWAKQAALVPKFYEAAIHIVTGALLPVWNRLGTGTIRIRRVKLTKGTRLLGRTIDPAELDEVLANLNVGQSTHEILPPEIIQKVLHEKWRAKIANGWWLKRSVVAGKERIEIDAGSNASGLYDSMQQLQNMGVVYERIQFTARYFLPSDETMLLSVLQRFIGTYPVVSLVPPAGKAGLASRSAESAAGSARDSGPFAKAMREAKGQRPKPKAPRPVMPPQEKKGLLREYFSEVRLDLRNAFAPQTATEQSAVAADSMRESTARAEHRLLKANHMLKAARIELDRKSPADVVTFLDNIERGQDQETPVLNEAAGLVREILDEARDAIRGLGTGKLKSFMEDYFPHLWENQKRAEEWAATFVKQRNWQGSKSFLKKRHIEFIVDGLRPESEGGPGLKLKHPNPIDAVMEHLHNVYKYVACHTWLQEGRRHGYVRAFSVESMPSPPPGWEKLDPRVGTIYGSNKVKLEEIVDQKLWDAATKILADLSIRHVRAPGTGRTGGLAVPDNDVILTRFASPMGDLWHEIGHILDDRYGLWSALSGTTKEVRAELDKLADERLTGGPTSKSFKKYIHSKEELIANLVDAYVTNREHFREMAPTAFKKLEAFLEKHAETKPIMELQPSLQRKRIENSQDLAGVLVKGYWAAPKPVARIVNRQLSPGLGNKKSYRGLRWAFNLVNAAQLGLSGFHWMFTNLDAMTSRGALGFYQMAKGDGAEGVKNLLMGLNPATPFLNVYRGHQIMKTALGEGTADIPEIEWVVQSGGRFRQESIYHTKTVEAFMRALRQKDFTLVAGNALPAFFELTGRPLMEWWVPRQKLGVFALIAAYEAKRLGPDADPVVFRHAMARAWDSVDNRMGQLVYDNLFWNRTVKDVLMLAVRSLGWNVGDLRELGGGIYDLVTIGKRMGAPGGGGGSRGGSGGEGSGTGARDLRDPVMTHRMAYGLYLAWGMGIIGGLIGYLTGNRPKELKDYYAPRTGAKNPDGTDERFLLATYIKDVLAYGTHPGVTLTHKLHPVFADIYYLSRNADFFNTEIHNPDDSFFKQRLDDAKFLAKELIPFSMREILEEPRNPNTKLPKWAPMFGVTRAPSYVTGTSLTEAMKAYAVQRSSSGAKPRTAADRAKYLSKVDDDLRIAKTPEERARILREVHEKEDAGELKPKDSAKVAKAGGMSPLAASYSRSMPIEIALDFWDLATADEKAQIKELLKEKAYGKVEADGSYRRATWPKTRTAKEREAINTRLDAIFKGDRKIRREQGNPFLKSGQ